MVYRWRPGQPSIATGDFLGDMTDELDGDVITEFVSGGAKNYGYTTRQGKVVCKVRGFTLNVRGAAILNFQTMKDNILAEVENPLDHRRITNVVTPYYFQRDLEKKVLKWFHASNNMFSSLTNVSSTRTLNLVILTAMRELGRKWNSCWICKYNGRRDVTRTSHTSRM